jgi:hypothetical protein
VGAGEETLVCSGGLAQGPSRAARLGARELTERQQLVKAPQGPIKNRTFFSIVASDWSETLPHFDRSLDFETDLTASQRA